MEHDPLPPSRSLPSWLAGPWRAWSVLLLMTIAATVVTAVAAAVDLGALGDPDALLGPIRWYSLPANLA